MHKKRKNRAGKWGWIAAGFAISVYVIGGLGVMTGLGFIGMLGSQNLWGWGEARSIGYLLFGVGMGLSVLGVLIMRIMRNRQWA